MTYSEMLKAQRTLDRIVYYFTTGFLLIVVLVVSVTLYISGITLKGTMAALVLTAFLLVLRDAADFYLKHYQKPVKDTGEDA